MSRSLPVPLQPNRTVEGPVIVIGRSDGVAQSPHTNQGFHEGPSELEEPHVGTTGAAGGIMERHLNDAPSLCMHSNEDFLQHVEVTCDQSEPGQNIAMVHAEPAGQITEREGQGPAVGAI